MSLVCARSRQKGRTAGVMRAGGRSCEAKSTATHTQGPGARRKGLKKGCACVHVRARGGVVLGEGKCCECITQR